MSNKSYIKYNILGISNLELKEDSEYEIENDVIKSILITNDLKNITLYLKSNKSGNLVEQKCDDFIGEYLLKLCLHSGTEVDNPRYGIESSHIIEEGISDIHTINSNIVIQTSCEIIEVPNAETFYEEVINSDKLKLNEDTKLKYKKLISILRNRNKVTRYLLLYELLQNLVPQNDKHRSQKDVADFIKKHEDKFCKLDIEFCKTRRLGYYYKEDMFTYCRNEIAHAEFGNEYEKYEKLSNNLTNRFINCIIEVINVAIIY